MTASGLANAKVGQVAGILPDNGNHGRLHK
jgi:hypothetical protein